MLWPSFWTRKHLYSPLRQLYNVRLTYNDDKLMEKVNSRIILYTLTLTGFLQAMIVCHSNDPFEYHGLRTCLRLCCTDRSLILAELARFKATNFANTFDLLPIECYLIMLAKTGPETLTHQSPCSDQLFFQARLIDLFFLVSTPYLLVR